MKKTKQKELKFSSTEDTSDIDDVYDVEKIVDKRTIRGRVEYLLKWKNYPEYLALLLILIIT